MTVLLVFPPQWNPFHVYPSLPSLQSYLKQRGEPPYLCDANIEFYNFLLTPDFRRLGIDRAERLLQQTSSGDSRREGIAYARDVLLSGEEFVRTITGIRERQVFENIHKRREVLAAWDTYLGAVSTLYPPLQLTYRGLKMPDLDVDLGSVLRFCASGEDNLFAVYYAHALRRHLLEVMPDVIGLSVVGLEQVIPSLTLCRLIKADFPSAHLTVGGGVFAAYLEATNEYDSLIGTLLDSIIIGSGGESLYRLIEALRSKAALSSVPGLVFKSESGALHKNNAAVEHADKPTATDYSGLNLSAYFHYDPTKSSE
jgi:anaerobic magnesium-protoporphyrin IX monomethyl ester cyclase